MLSPPHLRTVVLERGVILQDAGEDIERVYFLHSGMVSLVAVMPSGATVELQSSGAQGRSGPPQVSEQCGLLQERSCSCRARLCGFRRTAFSTPPIKVRPSAI
jgi:CRP-like cAMP-binding protein